MFVCFENGLKECRASAYEFGGPLTAAYLSKEELLECRDRLGFDESSVRACQEASGSFRTGVEVYPSYTFFELHVFDLSDPSRDDYIALFLRGNLMAVVNVQDEDGSSKTVFERAIRRFSTPSMNLEKLVFAFFTELMGKDMKHIEALRGEISEMEEAAIGDTPSEDFNREMLNRKKQISRMNNLYEQYLDFLEELETNENDIFASDTLLHISNLTNRVTRLKGDVDSMARDLEHITDAYFAHMDLKANKNMNYLTVLTSIFFPLTILVGWYGMNFQSMPEFGWKWGYLYFILLAAGVLCLMIFIAHRKGWFGTESGRKRKRGNAKRTGRDRNSGKDPDRDDA